ncbi:MAG: lipoate--protein ligase, partial [Oscillospiraceae bacterium]|nr:lipoate--protein ligase [Oscillospiraceae bacterium]
MTERLYLYEGVGFDPHYNLAVEQQLLETVQPGECILYLWQNQNTVVIGRNQNAWKECRVSRLESEGGTLARRLSGGGAVFHDLGNLNFTFLLPTADYDLRRQTAVILTACQSLGVPAVLSGRNDLTAEGKKFSGSAFYHNRGRSYHHGTLLVQVDMEKLGRYLNPSSAKLEAKGVDSVRARVVNLADIQPDITIPALKEALTLAFG